MVKTYYQCVLKSMVIDRIYTFEQVEEMVSYIKNPQGHYSRVTQDVSRGLRIGMEKNQIIQIRNPKEKTKYVRHKYMKIVES